MARLRKLSVKDIESIRARHSAGESISSLAQAFNVSRYTIGYHLHESRREACKDKHARVYPIVRESRIKATQTWRKTKREESLTQ